MDSEIVISLITGISVAVPSILATFFSNYQNTKKNEDNKKLTWYRLEELEKKVDKQNEIIQKTYKLEEEIKSIKEDIRFSPKNLGEKNE